MSRTVKNHGGVLVRLVHSIASFKAKHNTWPTAVLVGPASLDPLKEHHLTPEGLAAVQGKIALREGSDDTVIAADDATGHVFDYSNSIDDLPIDIEEAYGWLGLDRPY